MDGRGRGPCEEGSSVITKRSVMGIRERVESAVKELTKWPGVYLSPEELSEITIRDLRPALDDLDYLMELAS